MAPLGFSIQLQMVQLDASSAVRAQTTPQVSRNVWLTPNTPVQVETDHEIVTDHEIPLEWNGVEHKILWLEWKRVEHKIWLLEWNGMETDQQICDQENKNFLLGTKLAKQTARGKNGIKAG